MWSSPKRLKMLFCARNAHHFRNHLAVARKRANLKAPSLLTSGKKIGPRTCLGSFVGQEKKKTKKQLCQMAFVSPKRHNLFDDFGHFVHRNCSVQPWPTSPRVSPSAPAKEALGRLRFKLWMVSLGQHLNQPHVVSLGLFSSWF